MNLRRAGVVSLMLAVMAMAGASVAPARGADGRVVSAIVWQAREDRQAPVALERRLGIESRSIRHAAASTPGAARRAHAPVRHGLFQRPPPVASAVSL